MFDILNIDDLAKQIRQAESGQHTKIMMERPPS